MFIKIGPYKNWLGPYQIAAKLLFWIPEYDENYHKSDTVHNFGEWLANDKNGNDSWLAKICAWYHSKEKRKIKIRIDPYDSWNAHNTASLILLPLFKKLSEDKHGSGFIDDEDVPESLRSTSAPPKVHEYDTDDFLHDRYEWVLKEILFALEADNSDWEDQFTHEHAEIDLDKYPEDEGKTCIPVRWKKEGKYDWEGKRIYQERIDNGFRLMGKYWQTFWT
jgi:hypothetical protein